MTIKELREKRANIIADLDAMRNKVTTEKRSYTKEEFAAADKMIKEAGEIRAQIEELERQENVERGIRELTSEVEGRRTDPGQPGRRQPGRDAGTRSGRQPDEKRERAIAALPRSLRRFETDEYRAAFSTYLRGGMLALNEEQRSVLSTGYQTVELDAMDAETRALSVGTNSAGGFTVPPLLQLEVSEAMAAFIGPDQAGATQLRTASGAALPFPTANDTANSAVIVDEAASVGSETGITFGSTSIPTFMYSSKPILASLQLINDTFLNIDQYVTARIVERFGRALNAHRTTGTGSGQPQGIVTAMGTSGAGIGVATAANNAFTYDEVISLQHSVDIAYRNKPGVGYAMSDGIWLKSRLLKDSYGRPLFDDARDGGSPRLNGQTVYTFTAMPGLTAGAIPASSTIMLYGDFSYYQSREVVGSMVIYRLQEKYIENGQIAWLAFGRYGGGFINPGNFPVKGLRTIA